MDLQTDFESYWAAITADNKFEDRKEAAREEWTKYPEKHVPIMQWLKKHGSYPGRNPFFFIQDFKVRRSKGQPTNYRGQIIPPGVQVFSAKYNGTWGMYTQEDIDAFGLERPCA